MLLRLCSQSLELTRSATKIGFCPKMFPYSVIAVWNCVRAVRKFKFSLISHQFPTLQTKAQQCTPGVQEFRECSERFIKESLHAVSSYIRHMTTFDVNPLEVTSR